MAKCKSNKKIKMVTVNPIVYFEFDHMPSDQEIKEELLRSVKLIELDYKDIAYCVEVSYEEEHKGNFWDAGTQEFYKWNELQELAETQKDYKLMENSINGLHNNT